MKTTKKHIKRAHRLTNDELIGMLFYEVEPTKFNVALLREVRIRLMDSTASEDESDPRGA